MPRTCGNCGYEPEVEADACPLCGALLTAKAAAVGVDGVTGPVVAWEDPNVSFPANFVRTWNGFIAAPSRIFASVPFDNPVARPLLFYLFIAIVAAFFSLLVTAAMGVPEGFNETLSTYDLGFEMSPGALALVVFFATPFVLLFALLINSLVVHLFVVMLIRERRTLGATVRVMCYSIAPYPVAAIPIIGPMASSVWITVLVILGLREAHRTTTGRAAAAVLIPLAILVGFYILLIAFAVLLSVAEPS